MLKENIELFGAPIQTNKLNIDNDTLIEYCYKRKQIDQGRNFSNIGGWQSDDLNLQDVELQPFIEELKNNIMSYINQCGFKTDLKYKLDNIWININGYKDHNKPHIHPGCLFSGVYYLKTPENCGSIVFKHSADSLQYDWKKDLLREAMPNNCNEWFLPVQKGKMFIFPSWLYHYVMPNLNEKEDRISLAFNINL